MKITVETLKLYQRLLERPKSWLKNFLLAPEEESVLSDCPENVSENERDNFYRVAAKSWFPGERVLLVEDNEVCGETLQNLLERWGLEVILVNSCERALTVCRSGSVFNFALIDHSLPDGTGDDLARVFRESWPENKTSLISLSGNKFFPDESLYDLGMEKPLRPDFLRVEMVKLLIARASGRSKKRDLNLL